MEPPTRPSSAEELAQRALINIWDPNKDFKHWLRVAERCRNTGKDYVMMGDLENAFVEYVRAASLILDKMPLHKDYMTRLSAQQRESLTAVRKRVPLVGVFGFRVLIFVAYSMDKSW